MARIELEIYTPGYKPNGREVAVIETSRGTVRAELFGCEAPVTVGSLCMAHKSAPNSGSCQFYFSLDEQPEFDDKYTVFGQATEGLEVIEQLAIGDAIKGIVIEGADEEALAEAIAQDTPRPPTPQEALAAIEAERAERAAAKAAVEAAEVAE